MAKRIPWHRSVGGRLGAAAGVVLLVCAGLMAATTWSTRALSEGLTWVNETGKLRRSSYHLLFLIERLDEAAEGEREDLQRELREVSGEFGPRALRVARETDGTAIGRLRGRWQERIEPLIREAAGGRVLGGREQSDLERLLREQASDADDAVTAAVEGNQRLARSAQRFEWALVLLVLAAVAAAWLIGQSIARRTRLVAEVADRIARGELRLTAPDTGRDEIGALGSAFNTMTISLRGKIEERAEAHRRLDELLGTVKETAGRVAAASELILESTVQQASGARQQAAATAETSTIVEEVTRTAAQATERAHEVVDAARLSEETGQAGRAAVEEALESVRTVRAQVERIAEGMVQLAERARAIGEIIEMVDDIAGRTQLLALNAAIEASRAGEQGHGFAVVAAEIKELAEQSRTATVQVRQILGDIQRAADQAVMSTEQGSRSAEEAAEVVANTDRTIESLMETIGDSAQRAQQIEASAGQQAYGVSQIRDAVRSIDQAARESLEATQKAEKAARELDELASRLGDLLRPADERVSRVTPRERSRLASG